MKMISRNDSLGSDVLTTEEVKGAVGCEPISFDLTNPPRPTYTDYIENVLILPSTTQNHDPCLYHSIAHKLISLYLLTLKVPPRMGSTAPLQLSQYGRYD